MYKNACVMKRVRVILKTGERSRLMEEVSAVPSPSTRSRAFAPRASSATMTDALMTRLTTATTEEGKTVTYKWVAREFDVPVNHAKRLLFAHASKNDSVLVATHVVSGWTSVAGGDDGAGITRTQVVRLVEGAEALAAAKAALDEVTGEHVYSVRPVDAKDATVGGDSKSLPPACVAQTDAMFDASPSTPNALRDNRHSAVRCASAKRDDGPARRVAAKPKPSTAKKPEPPKTSAKAEPAAATAGKAGPPAAPASSKPSGGKSKPPGAFAGFKPVDKNAAVAPKPTAKPAGKGAGAMAAMFARAPPKKAAAAATAATAATARGGDARARSGRGGQRRGGGGRDYGGPQAQARRRAQGARPRRGGGRGGGRGRGGDEGDGEGGVAREEERREEDRDEEGFDADAGGEGEEQTQIRRDRRTRRPSRRPRPSTSPLRTRRTARRRSDPKRKRRSRSSRSPPRAPKKKRAFPARASRRWSR